MHTAPPPVPAPRPWLTPLSAVYGAAASARRKWADQPGRRRRLRQPVVSVGSLTVGGAGKTPVVRVVAEMLRDAGERPAILSRGYARRQPDEEAVVVHDGMSVRADLARAGDEPLMLARQLGDLPVVVAADRYLGGRLAESRLGATVHVLDDGFQHVSLDRDVDLLLVRSADVLTARVLPAGPLRERATAAALADAWIVPDRDGDDLRGPAQALGVDRVFDVQRGAGVPRLVEPWNAPPRQPRTSPVVAVAGLARPGQFFAELEREGWTIGSTLSFRDHHPYSRDDVARVEQARRRAGASLVVTTEKDVMRWLPLRPLPFALAWVPLTAAIVPADVFRAWLTDRVAAARASRPPRP